MRSIDLVNETPCLTYRQLDYWISAGLIAPSTRAIGSGFPREIPDSEVAVVRLMVPLVAEGLTPHPGRPRRPCAHPRRRGQPRQPIPHHRKDRQLMGKRMDPAWNKKWRIDRERGFKRLVPVGPVAGHCWDLENAGMPRRAIAEAAGVSATSVSNVMLGRHPTMQRAIAAKILAVKADDILERDRQLGFVPAIGARRRIRALYAIGHTAATIATAIDQPDHFIHNRMHHPGRWITRAHHDLVTTAYNRLWDTPGPSATNRRRALAKGWPPPMAYDDETIDDPTVEPFMAAPDERRTAGLPPLTGRPCTEVAEDVDFLLEQDGMATADQVANRLHMGKDSLQQALRRANRPDLLDTLNRNAEHAGHSVRRAATTTHSKGAAA